MEKVTGIGGFLFRSKDSKAMAQWYLEHLGINLIPTDGQQESWKQEAGTTAFSPFDEKTTYWPAEKNWMLNFRVSNLDAMVKQLTDRKIEVKVDPEAYPYGRFARLYDPEGNPIELWEPK